MIRVNFTYCFPLVFVLNWRPVANDQEFFYLYENVKFGSIDMSYYAIVPLIVLMLLSVSKDCLQGVTWLQVRV